MNRTPARPRPAPGIPRGRMSARHATAAAGAEAVVPRALPGAAPFAPPEHPAPGCGTDPAPPRGEGILSEHGKERSRPVMRPAEGGAVRRVPEPATRPVQGRGEGRERRPGAARAASGILSESRKRRPAVEHGNSSEDRKTPPLAKRGGRADVACATRAAPQPARRRSGASSGEGQGR